MKNLVRSLVAIASIFSACNNNPQPLDETREKQLLHIGDSLSTTAQKALLMKVMQAMEEKGPVGALEYCSLNANALTDSLSKVSKAKISRLSDKNRNPENKLATETDRQAWDSISKLMADTAIKEKHLLIQDKNQTVYYKAILIGMPACLNCHGVKGQDIAEETLKAIAQKYPADLASGYRLGELRGMWKIKL